MAALDKATAQANLAPWGVVGKAEGHSTPDYLRNTALSTSLTPMAPTKRDWSSNNATGAVCERCMASITVLSIVPGVAQITCEPPSGCCSTSTHDTHSTGLPDRSAAVTKPFSSRR